MEFRKHRNSRLCHAFFPQRSGQEELWGETWRIDGTFWKGTTKSFPSLRVSPSFMLTFGVPPSHLLQFWSRTVHAGSFCRKVRAVAVFLQNWSPRAEVFRGRDSLRCARHWHHCGQPLPRIALHGLVLLKWLVMDESLMYTSKDSRGHALIMQRDWASSHSARFPIASVYAIGWTHRNQLFLNAVECRSVKAS